MNDTTRQIGGALGVAIIGSVLASSYRPAMDAATATWTCRPQVAAAARDSVGGAVDAAASIGGQAGQALADAAQHRVPPRLQRRRCSWPQAWWPSPLSWRSCTCPPTPVTPAKTPTARSTASRPMIFAEAEGVLEMDAAAQQDAAAERERRTHAADDGELVGDHGGGRRDRRRQGLGSDEPRRRRHHPEPGRGRRRRHPRRHHRGAGRAGLRRAHGERRHRAGRRVLGHPLPPLAHQARPGDGRGRGASAREGRAPTPARSKATSGPSSPTSPRRSPIAASTSSRPSPPGRPPIPSSTRPSGPSSSPRAWSSCGASWPGPRNGASSPPSRRPRPRPASSAARPTTAPSCCASR